MIRRFVPHCLAILLLCLTLQASQSAQPDVVVIVADDLGWGDLGCFGSDEVHSPALDQLAAEGQKWTQFYANCCVCSPTRASILSGCYPDRVGVPGVIRTHAENSWGNLIGNVDLLPEVLSKQGYQTAAIGKWHLGLDEDDTPNNRGFDHFHGFLGDMMDDYFHHLRHGNNYMRLNETPINPAGHATHLFTDWAKLAIEEMASNEKPYFLYLAYNAPHTPIQPPEPALKAVQERLKGTETEVTEKRAKLIALIEDMDAGIGRVLSAIDGTGRDTLVIFVSDNGGQLNAGANNGPLRSGKQSNYEGGLRVPAIVRWPGKIQPGTTTNAIGVTMDILPTVCAAVGSPAPSDIDGLNLMPWLSNPAAPSIDREVYYVRREGGAAYRGLTIEALRSGDWKLVHNLPTEPFELFNLKNDPYEQKDLAKTNPKKLRELAARMMLHIQAAGAVPWQ